MSLVITLCGSARFEAAFKEWNLRLTLEGHVVHTLAAYPSDQGGKDWYTPGQKKVLDDVYLLKILQSDAILVLDVGGYIGEGCAREINFAKENGIISYYLSQGGQALTQGGLITAEKL